MQQRHKTDSQKKTQSADVGTDFADSFNPWEDPLGLGPLDSSGQEQNARQSGEEYAAPMDNPARTITAEDQISALKTEMEEIRLRYAAEMENFKKRLKREHDEQMRYAAEKVLSDLLPSLDNLDLALQYGSKNEACNDLLQGVAMTRRLLLEAVAGHGLISFGSEGDTFAPEIHEAVGIEKREGLEEGAVSRVLQSGYKLGDRLLRPAKVMIHQ